MTVQDVYLLALHEPYETREHPVPINATIVHARTLLHVEVPQPDGGMMYRCLTEFPRRLSGGVVPLSTLTFELDGGKLWGRVGDWEAVVEVVVDLSRGRRCDAVPLALPSLAATLLAGGPTTVHQVRYTDGSSGSVGPEERREQLEELTAHVRRFAGEEPFWPGDRLVSAPQQSVTDLYRPYRQ